MLNFAPATSEVGVISSQLTKIQRIIAEYPEFRVCA